MTVTLSIASKEVDSEHCEMGFFGRACFGVCNHLDDFRRLKWNNSGGDFFTPETVQNLEMLDFWPHINNNQMASIPEELEVFNSIACYKDMLTYTSAGTIQVNLRDNPADKVFTGLMTFRDMLYGYYRGLEFLYTGIDDKEELLKRKRIALALRLAGVSANMFGHWEFDHSRYDSGDESSAIYIDESMSAMAYLPLISDDAETFSEVWVQQPVGEGRNGNGYIRNHHQTSLCNVAVDYSGLPPSSDAVTAYRSMSHWLRLWTMIDNKKPAGFASRRDQLTIAQFHERIESRIRGVELSQQGDIVTSLFDELKEFYHD